MALVRNILWIWLSLLVDVVLLQETTEATVLIDSPCFYDSMCTIPNSYCQVSKTCGCKAGFSPNDAKNKCLTVLINTPCFFDSMCTIPNSYCQVSKTCGCKAGFSLNDDKNKCLTVLIDTPCFFDSMCTIPNSYCQVSKTCSCKAGFLLNDDKNKCLTVHQKTEVGDPCNDDGDCLFSVNPTRCSDGICRPCNEGTIKDYSNCVDPAGCSYHEYGNSCWKNRKLGEKCENNEECWVLNNSHKTRECKSSICQCNKDHELMSGPLPKGIVDQCLSIKRSSASRSGSTTMVITFSLLFSWIVISSLF